VQTPRSPGAIIPSPCHGYELIEKPMPRYNTEISFANPSRVSEIDGAEYSANRPREDGRSTLAPHGFTRGEAAKSNSTGPGTLRDALI